MRPAYKFYGIGFGVAALEEFVSQGVLKGKLAGWIVPTIIAFLPFLVIVRTVGAFLDRRWPPWKAGWIYYFFAGGIGLAVEWFLIGLSPWSGDGKHPVLMLLLQVGMFCFWSAVACVPRVMVDDREVVGRTRQKFARFVIIGMAFIYGITFVVPTNAQFAAGIGSIVLVFVWANFYYFRYLMVLRSALVASH